MTNKVFVVLADLPKDNSNVPPTNVEKAGKELSGTDLNKAPDTEGFAAFSN